MIHTGQFALAKRASVLPACILAHVLPEVLGRLPRATTVDHITVQGVPVCILQDLYALLERWITPAHW